jgi:Tol biopolymer transport system component
MIPRYRRSRRHAGRALSTTALAVLTAASIIGCDKGTKPKSVVVPQPPSGYGIVYPEHQVDPAWSSQGMIAYHDNGLVCAGDGLGWKPDTSLAGLWVLDLNAGAKRRLLPFGHSPAWSPDGSRLMFEEGGRLFAINVDGTGFTQYTLFPNNPCFLPCWSGDGTSVVFDTDVPSPLGDWYDLWIMTAATGADVRRLCDPVLGGRRCAGWPPYGSRLAMEFQGEIYLLDPETCEATRVTHDGALDYYPRLSPEGLRIAYQAIGPQICLINIDGSGARQLTTQGGEEPAWSPDGTQIVFTGGSHFNYTPGQGVLWIHDLRTGVETQLTHQWGEYCASALGAGVRPSDRDSQVPGR